MTPSGPSWRRCAAGCGCWRRRRRSCARPPGFLHARRIAERPLPIRLYLLFAGVIASLCRVAGVERGGFYAWRAAEPARAAKASADATLTGRIGEDPPGLQVHLRRRGVAPDLAEGADGAEPERTNHKKVARLMCDAGMHRRRERRRRSKTRQDMTAAAAPGLLGRDFGAEAPGRQGVWRHHLRTRGRDRAHLHGYGDRPVQRLPDRMVDRRPPPRRLVKDALSAAVAARGGPGAVRGVIFHRDWGSEYISTPVAGWCREQGIRRSMGRVGSCFDNAAAESFFASVRRRGDAFGAGLRGARLRPLWSGLA